MAAALVAGIGAGLAYIGCVLCCKGIEYCQHKKKAHQQDDIYNISSRVQHQDQWPTHDAFLSIPVRNETNKPLYDDAPPSYDEVMKTELAINGESSTPTDIVVEAPKTIETPTRH